MTFTTEHHLSPGAGVAAAKRGERSSRVQRAYARLADERGVAAVEFALVLTLLCVVMLGIAKFGLAFNAAADETHLADEAARYAAVNYNPGGAQALGAWIKTQGGTAVTRGGTVCFSFPDGNSNPGSRVRVVVTSGALSWQPFSTLAHLTGLPATIQGQATMRLEASPSVYTAGCS